MKNKNIEFIKKIQSRSGKKGKHMFRKMIALTLAGVLAAGLAACGTADTQTKETTAENTTAVKEETTETEESEEIEEAGTIVGGWTTKLAENARDMEDYQEVFDEAAGQVDCILKPVALLGTQVVAGENYCFLATVDGASAENPDYKLVFAYRDLDGNVELTSVLDLDITAENAGESDTEQLAGGWTIAEDTYANPGKDDVAILDKAQEELTGAEYQLISILGTQVVAGTNYLMLCKEVTVTAEPFTSLALVTVYEDLDGNTSISDVKDFSVSWFADMAAAQMDDAEADNEEEVIGEIVGGWTLRDSEEAIFDEDMQAIYDEASLQAEDCEMRPIAVLGTQVVAGTNYCFLVEVTPVDGSTGEADDSEYALMFVYHDLEGGNSLTGMQIIDLTADTFGEASGLLMGGWTATSMTYAMPGKDMVEICDSAADSQYTLITPLATQVVSGTNYMMLCETAVTGDDEIPELKMVTVYQDLDGNTSVTDVKDFSITWFAEMLSE